MGALSKSTGDLHINKASIHTDIKHCFINHMSFSEGEITFVQMLFAGITGMYINSNRNDLSDLLS